MSARTYTPTQALARSRGALTPGEVVDLILIAELMILLPGLLMVDAPWLRIPLGLFAVLFAPGYALVAALFPAPGALDAPARIALSVGLSVALLPLLALLLNSLPWGLAPLPMAVGLTVITCVGCLAAGVRRYFLGDASSLVSAPSPRRPWSGAHYLALLGACSVAIWGAAVYAAVLQSPPAMTEFYALGRDGQAVNYPRAAAAGVPLTVELGISNREGQPQRYRIEVRSGERLLAAEGPLALDDGASWRGPVSFPAPAAGADRAIEILLFAEPQVEPYRQLQLWLDVEARP